MMSARLHELAAQPEWCWTQGTMLRAGAKGCRAVGIARTVKFWRPDFGCRILHFDLAFVTRVGQYTAAFGRVGV